jgi:TonB family protein
MPVDVVMLLATALGATAAEPVCTPPSLAHVSPPKYPPAAVAEQLEGMANLLMRVGTDGTVKEIVVRQSSGHAVLDEAATAAAAQWTFNPMVCDGTPREAWTSAPFRFSLADLPTEPENESAAPPLIARPSAAMPAMSPLRQTPHIVEQDPDAMGFSSVAGGERVLAQMGLEKHESPGFTFWSGGPDLSRIWMTYWPTGTKDKAIVRVRSTYEGRKAVHRYAVLCEGSDAWCQELRNDIESQLRTDPPPMPPPPPSR